MAKLDRPRDIAIFLILRYTGMRRESVASLRMPHLDSDWGLRGVYIKGGKTRDIPLPSVVMKFLHTNADLRDHPAGPAQARAGVRERRCEPNADNRGRKQI